MTPLGINTSVIEHNLNEINNSNEKQNGLSKPLEVEQQIVGQQKLYKLIIQVAKIKTKPGPKSKKLAQLAAARKQEIEKVNDFLKIRKKLVPTIKETMVIASKPATEIQDVNQEVSESSKNIADKNIRCHICKEIFSNIDELTSHKKEIHFLCKICDFPCGSAALCDVHAKLHDSTDSQFPLKCHLCDGIFVEIIGLKMHYRTLHSEKLIIQKETGAINLNNSEKSTDSQKSKNPLEYQCKICQFILWDEKSYRDHALIHTTDPITLASGENGNSEENSNLISKNKEKIEKVKESTIPRCGMCYKYFKTHKILAQHLAMHYSRAHHCTICRKAFINRVALNNHIKTHDTQ